MRVLVQYARCSGSVFKASAGLDARMIACVKCGRLELVEQHLETPGWTVHGTAASALKNAVADSASQAEKVLIWCPRALPAGYGEHLLRDLSNVETLRRRCHLRRTM